MILYNDDNQEKLAKSKMDLVDYVSQYFPPLATCTIYLMVKGVYEVVGKVALKAEEHNEVQFKSLFLSI